MNKKGKVPRTFVGSQKKGNFQKKNNKNFKKKNAKSPNNWDKFYNKPKLRAKVDLSEVSSNLIIPHEKS